MKAIVVYYSKTGFTEKYARWIAEELQCEVKSLKNMEASQYADYDVIIYGGGLMAGRIAKLDKIKSNPNLHGKKFIVFATGTTNKDAIEVIEKMKEENLTKEEQKEVPFYYFEGGINYEKMGLLSRTMMRGIYKSLLKKNDRTEVETGMMYAIEKTKDATDKKYIVPLIEYIRNFSNVS